jgi:hypothetical protein
MGTAPQIDGKSMAARPESIAGRTIFLIDAGYDNSKEFMAELRNWFAKNHSSVTINDVHLDNIAEPAPEIYERVARDGDFAICAVGLCSMCAPAVTNHVARLEHDYQVPCVAVHDHAFAKLVASASRMVGMPNLRHVFLPSPVRGRTADEFARSITGANMATGRAFMDDLLSALTQRLSSDDATGLTYKESPADVVDASSEDAMQDLFHERGWTDSLPIVVPTAERVAAMLAGTSRRPDEIVGQIRATKTRPFWTVTVEQVAINAVMAGARPEHLPTILAIFSSGYTARHSSTSSIGRMIVLNGPVRHEIGANSGIGALGPYSRTNSVIGRAYGLGSQNLQGGSEAGVTFAGSMGNPFALTNLTFAENEERSPWEPLHVQYGYGAEESTATIFGMVRSLMLVPAGILPKWREHARSALSGLRSGAGATLLLDPLAAQDLVTREGFTDKAALREWMVENGRISAARWRDRPRPNRHESLAAQGIEPWTSYFNAPADELLPMNTLEDVHVVVVGGGTLPCWGLADGLTNKSEYNHIYGTTVSIDKWR